MGSDTKKGIKGARRSCTRRRSSGNFAGQTLILPILFDIVNMCDIGQIEKSI